MALFLAPARHADLRGDDAWNFYKRGLLELRGENLGDLLTDAVTGPWAAGRPQALGGIQGQLVTWLFDGHPTLYRYLLIALTLAAGALLYVLARRLGASRPVGFLVLVLLAGSIQFRPYHDALLGYYGTTQLTLICILGSLIAFLRGLRAGSLAAYVLSAGLFLAALLCYEYAYSLSILHLGVALIERRGRAALLRAAPFVALSALFVIGVYLARRTSEVVPTGYQVGADPAAVVRTYLIQLLPPVPGSYLLFRPSEFSFYPIAGSPTKAELLAGAWRAATVFLATTVTALLALRHRTLPERGRLVPLVVVGLLLWFAPVIFVSFAPKYQEQLNPGTGHLPTLLQVFGVALVAAAAALALVRMAAGRSRAAAVMTALAAGAVLAAGAGVVGFNNLRIAAMERPMRESRELVEAGLRRGLLDDLPARSSVVFSDRDVNWQTGGWQYMPESLEAMVLDRADKLVDGRILSGQPQPECAATGAFPPPECAPLQRSAYWVRVRPRPGGGTMILGQLPASRTTVAQSGVVRRIRAYTWVESGRPTPPPLTGQTSRGRVWNSGALDWTRVRSGDGWALYEARLGTRDAPVASLVDDARSRFDLTAFQTPGDWVRIYGTKWALP